MKQITLLLIGAALILGASWATADAVARLDMDDVIVPSGARLVVPVLYSAPAADGPATIVIRLRFSASALTVLDVRQGTAASGKTLDYQVDETMLSIALFGGDAPIASGMLLYLVLELAVALEKETSFVFVDAGTHGADADAGSIPVTVSGGALEVTAAYSHHSADTGGDWRISLPELLRLIHLYQAGEYHCAPDSADGFAPGPGPRDCSPHDGDYSPRDWRISFYELLRIIQLYNSPYGAYHLRVPSEDGFAPGPFNYPGVE